jgi:hypothetical protein
MPGKPPSVYVKVWKWIITQDPKGDLRYDKSSQTWSCRMFGHIRSFRSEGTTSLPELDGLYPLKPGVTTGRTWEDRSAGPLIPTKLEVFAQTFRDRRP